MNGAALAIAVAAVGQQCPAPLDVNATVLHVISTEAVNELGGMKAAIDVTQQIMGNSWALGWHSVAFVQMDWHEDGWDADGIDAFLLRMQDGADGDADGLHVLREQYGADVVAFWFRGERSTGGWFCWGIPNYQDTSCDAGLIMYGYNGQCWQGAGSAPAAYPLEAYWDAEAAAAWRAQPCPGDVTLDEVVGVPDLLSNLQNWDPSLGFLRMAQQIANWGDC